MSLTALEIKQQEFAKSMRGCDPAEVKAFLDLAASEWEHLKRKNEELAKQVEDLEEKLEHYKQVEKDLHETLKSARESVQTKMESAEQKAEHTIEKAEMQADSIIKEAEQERRQTHAQVLQLSNRRTEIVAGIRSYLLAAIDSLDHFEDEQTIRFKSTADSSDKTSTEVSSTDDQEEQSRPDSSYETTSSPDNDALDDLVDDLD